MDWAGYKPWNNGIGGMEGLSVDHVDISRTDSPALLNRIYPGSLSRDSHAIQMR